MQDTSAERFWRKVNKDGPISPDHPDLGQCWVWRLPGGIGGYGAFRYQGRGMSSHRASYLMEYGSIEPGLHIDHLCRIRNCVRPSHLEAVTPAENTRRAGAALAGASFQRSKTHCPAGHPYAGENLRIAKDGKRACRACERRYSAEHRERKRAANPDALPRRRKGECRSGHPYAEHGFINSAGRQCCRICSRLRVQESRARRKALLPAQEPRTTCPKGHAWVDENLYVTPTTGQKVCRPCHNERTLAAYHERRRMNPPIEKPPRTHCKNDHPWVAENLFRTLSGYEQCRVCARDAKRRHDQRKAAAKKAAASA